MRRPLLRAFPRATYTGIEVSSHICERYGWTHASIASYRTRTRFDLVICYDVLQYLTDAEAARALANLGRLCRGALFLHAPTREDWLRNADRSCSDEDIHLRSTDWYRSRLARRFRHVGFGLYVRRSVPLVQWELAKAAHKTKGMAFHSCAPRQTPVSFLAIISDVLSKNHRFFSRPLHARRDCSLTRRS